MKTHNSKKLLSSSLNALLLVGIVVGIVALLSAVATAQTMNDSLDNDSDNDSPDSELATSSDEDITPTDEATTTDEIDTETTTETPSEIPSETPVQNAEPTAAPDESLSTSPPLTGSTIPAPMIVEIENDGSVLIRGTALTVNANTLELESWGGTWLITLLPGSKVISGTATGSNDFTSIQIGDFVGIEGNVEPGKAMTVSAVFVRNWTKNPYPGDFAAPKINVSSASAQAPITAPTANGALFPPTPSITVPQGTESTDSNADILQPEDDDDETVGTENSDDEDTDDEESEDDETESETEEMWSGEIDEVMTDSFTFTDNDIEYTVEVTGADLVNEDGEEIELRDIDDGDKIILLLGELDEGDDETIIATRVEIDTSWFQ